MEEFRMAVETGRTPGIPYHCSGCGFISSGWSGRCAGCGAWNTFALDV
jgi:predicted ATP-dependent serine protease